MKGFVTSCAIVVVAILVVEIFCPAKVMKKSLYMAFGIISVMVLVQGATNLFKPNNEFGADNISLKLEESGVNILSLGAERAKVQVIKALESAGVEVIDVDIDYYINELSLVIEGVEVAIKNEKDQETTLKIIKDTMGLMEEQIHICVIS